MWIYICKFKFKQSKFEYHHDFDKWLDVFITWDKTNRFFFIRQDTFKKKKVDFDKINKILL